MTIAFQASGDIPPSATVLAVPVFAGLALADGAGAEINLDFLAACGFEGKPGESQPLLATDGSTVLAVGVGDPAALDADVLRRAGAAVARASGPARSVAVTLTSAAAGRLDRTRASQAVVEGIALGGYRFTAHKPEARPGCLESVFVVGGTAVGVRRGRQVAEAVGWARDWVNEPPRDMTPRRLAALASDLAFDAGLDVDVWDTERIEQERLGALLGVAAGSAEPPRLIRLAYEPVGGGSATVALVGKGITFDSGGLSLKTADGMMTMKSDMGGAAAVIAAMGAIAALGSPARVVAYACCTENMPSGTAIHPGDVLTARNGRTIEVLNTDAEGRLVLADGLTLATEERPDAIIDLATLTGAQRVATGNEVAALLSNHDGLAAAVTAAAGRAGEPVWRLPLWPGYRGQLDSEVADLKNIGEPRSAGTIVAALFLQEFVAGRPWAHLDIAAPAWSDRDDGWLTKGATGWGVRTLVELLRSFSPLR
jgi:leucyl aminopeptidase